MASDTCSRTCATHPRVNKPTRCCKPSVIGAVTRPSYIAEKFTGNIPARAYRIQLSADGTLQCVEHLEGKERVPRQEPCANFGRRIGVSVMSALPIKWLLMTLMRHRELHRTERIGWLRAAVLGANEGIVSTASLVLGIAAADAAHESILLAEVAGLVSDAPSMAAGEYVSVSSQADTERADLARERNELATQRPAEEEELAAIYVGRGLEPALARTVALQLMAHDALGAHARDELGHSERLGARPLQAALASAGTFSVGAALPILSVLLAPPARLTLTVSGVSLICLVALGSVAGRTGGASAWKGAVRVGFWGALAMAATAGAFRSRGLVTGELAANQHA